MSIKKLMLLCGMALVAMTFGASTASATTPVEVIDESTLEHCDPCVVEAQGESHLNLFGGRVSTCEDHFVASIGEDGTGTIEYTNENHHDPPPPTDCTRVACNGVGEAAEEHIFDITGTEEDGPGVGEMKVDFCLDAASNQNGTGQHCLGDVIVTDLGNHNYMFSLHQPCLGGLIEVEGEWSITGGDPIEIVHL